MAKGVFEFDDVPRRAGQTRSPGWPGWLTIFTAQFAATLLAGVILFFGVRAYVIWSVADTMAKMRDAFNKQPAWNAPP